MLLRHNGAKAGTALSNTATNAMTSFSGTNTLASDAAKRTFSSRAGRGAYVSRPKLPQLELILTCLNSASSNSVRRSITNLWTPAHGIIFANPAQSSPRRLNTSSPEANQTGRDTIDTSYLNLATERSQGTEGSIRNNSEGRNGLPSSLGSASSSQEKGLKGEVVDPKLPTQNSTPAASQEEAAPELAKEKSAKETTQEDAELEYEPLPFSIPTEVFEKAKAAAEGHPDSYWTHKLYTHSATPTTKIKVHYCKSLHTSESVLQKHFLNKPVLGFDIEWKIGSTAYSSPKKNVSLIQIACADRIILIHIGLFPGESPERLVAPTLKAIMEDASVLKCGVAIKADCTRLRKFLGIETRGIFELSHLHRLVTYSASEDYHLINKRLVSLTEQAQTHLGLPIFKGEVRGSDWSEALSMEQILYAASDAYAGLVIFDELERKRRGLEQRPPRPWPAELGRPIRLASGVEIKAEPAEDAEEDQPRKTAVDAPHQSAAESLDVEVDPSDCADTTSPTESKTTPKSPKKPKPSPAILDPVVEEAAEFALKYRATYPKTAATPAQLRAYHIWQSKPEMSVEDIAAKLRDPPLQTATVTNYILEAVRTEGRGITGSVAWLVDPLKVGGDGADVRGLPVELERLRKLLGQLPESTKGTWRWKGVWKSVEKM